MKNFELKKEIWIWIIMILPLWYLWHIWPALPEIVPTHFGMDGKPNDWSHKTMLAYLLPSLLVGIYALFTFIPMIDPKGKIDEMGNKYFLLKLVIMLTISAICYFIAQSAFTGNIGNTNSPFLLIGGLFIFLGNYMQTVRPNYFIGFRTPWTLENETVWRKTHKMGGRLYFIVGLVVLILPFIIHHKFHMALLLGIIVSSLIPAIYSFVIYKQLKRTGS